MEAAVSSRRKRKLARRIANVARGADAQGTVSWTELMKAYCPESPKRRRMLAKQAASNGSVPEEVVRG